MYEAGTTADPDDVGALVVRLAVNLVTARKGILLTVPDGANSVLRVTGCVDVDRDLGAHPELQRIAARALAEEKTLRVARVADPRLAHVPTPDGLAQVPVADAPLR